jgi:hypothetical protein
MPLFARTAIWMRRPWLRQALLAAAALAMLAAHGPQTLAQSQRTIRSTNDPRPLPANRLYQPYWRETQSHRGWEIREPQYVVFANTNRDDAHWAAGQVQQAWASAERLADRWTDAHRQPGFGQGSTQIVIDSEPRRERDGPPTTVNVVGVQTQIYLSVAPGEPTLRQQVIRLREAAAFALLHTAGLDAAVPPWVAQGLAAHAAEQGLDPADAKAAKDVKLAARFGGEQWRYKRSGQDALDYPAFDEAGAAASIQFLLQGDDGQHAPALLAAIRTSWDQARQTAAEGGQFRGLPGDAQPAATDTSFDWLLADLGPQFAAWKQDPLAGQPVFDPDPKLAPELLAAEQEMLVLLKLQRMLAIKSSAGGPRPRVTTFDPKEGRQVVVSNSSRPAPPVDFQDLVRRLSDLAAQPVATLDVDGSLLLSTDKERMDELLHQPGAAYSFAKRGDQLALVRQQPGGTVLQGWLESNPNKAARPVARFEVVNTRSRGNSSARPAVQEARLPRAGQSP